VAGIEVQCPMITKFLSAGSRLRASRGTGTPRFALYFTRSSVGSQCNSRRRSVALAVAGAVPGGQHVPCCSADAGDDRSFSATYFQP